MRIPVIVLSGFLGSGKTTLLLRLLEETRRRGLQPGILMNELGKQDVDGLILDEHSDASVERLFDGCVCCSKKSELAGCLSLLLRKKPDLIIIELTGVANPEEIADALTEPGLIGHLRLRKIITLLDAEHALDYNSIFASDKQLVRTLRRQLEVADYVVVNKIDFVRPAHLQKIQKVIRKQNDRALIALTTYSSVDLSYVLEDIEKTDGQTKISVKRFRMVKARPISDDELKDNSKRVNYDHEDHRSYSRVQTVTLSWESSRPITREKIERFLQQWKDRILRAKGYLYFPDQKQSYLMQHAGKRTYWAPSSFSESSYIVIIGIELDEERLIREWNGI